MDGFERLAVVSLIAVRRTDRERGSQRDRELGRGERVDELSDLHLAVYQVIANAKWSGGVIDCSVVGLSLVPSSPSYPQEDVQIKARLTMWKQIVRVVTGPGCTIARVGGHFCRTGTALALEQRNYGSGSGRSVCVCVCVCNIVNLRGGCCYALTH